MADCVEERFCRVADGRDMRLPHRLAVPSFLWFSRFGSRGRPLWHTLLRKARSI